MESLAQIKNIGDANNVPRVVDGGLYVSAMVGRWRSPASLALEENVDAFARAIEPSVLITYSDDQTQSFFNMLGANAADAPILLVTSLHPSDWDRLGSDDRFLQLRMGKFNGTAEAVRYLQKLSVVIAKTNPGKGLNSISWTHRTQQIRRLSKKVPVLNLVGFAV